MLLTRASEYALLSLNIIAKSDKPLGVEQLSNQLNIPKSFLAKILQNLTKSKILISHRGAHGGYTLKCVSANISLYDIVNSVESKKAVVFDCISYSDTCPKGTIGTCAISPFLTKFQIKIDNYLKNLTLKELVYDK